MDKELLMLYGARHAVLQMIDKGNGVFVKKINDDNTCQMVYFEDICNYLTDMINKYETEGVKPGRILYFI